MASAKRQPGPSHVYRAAADHEGRDEPDPADDDEEVADSSESDDYEYDDYEEWDDIEYDDDWHE